MKTVLFVFVVLVLGCNYNPKSFNEQMADVREYVAKRSDSVYKSELSWEKTKDSIYKLADTNSVIALSSLDFILEQNKSLDRFQISDIHSIKGDIYFRIDSFQKAIDEFSFYSKGTPKYLAAEAGSYISLKEYENAYYDLKRAAKINWEYNWNLGNFYEIIGGKDSAISCYKRLYLRDTIIYKMCNDRIMKLSEPKTKPLKKLIFIKWNRPILRLRVR